VLRIVQDYYLLLWGSAGDRQAKGGCGKGGKGETIILYLTKYIIVNQPLAAEQNRS
jgi:hypothetical protein